jgi:hypothetical protein
VSRSSATKTFSTHFKEVMVAKGEWVERETPQSFSAVPVRLSNHFVYGIRMSPSSGGLQEPLHSAVGSYINGLARGMDRGREDIAKRKPRTRFQEGKHSKSFV